MYSIPGYKHIYNCRESGKGGGVSLYVHNDISYSNRTDLNTMSDFAEAVFIEVDKSIFNTNKNVIMKVNYVT